MHKLTKRERHVVIYIDHYEISEDELVANFGSIEGFQESADIDQWKVMSEVDEVSNREGTYEVEWSSEDDVQIIKK